MRSHAVRSKLVWAIFSAGIVAPVHADEDELFDLEIEALFDVDVEIASRFPQKSIEAPAAVSIVTAEEIETFGYRTLAEILGSVRGMHTSYDHNYHYLGVRGTGRSDNYNNRFLLLVDGYRMNDTIYENAAIGTDFPLDPALIDRVEIVRGPGSSIYGSNAFLGVINVITKSGGDFDGFAVSGQAGSLGALANRLSYGKQYGNGAELLLSASRYRSDGQDSFFFPDLKEVPEKNFGVVAGLDADRYDKLSAKLAYGRLTVAASYADRNKEVPTASFSSMINQPNETDDSKFLLGLGYTLTVAPNLDLSAQTHYGRNAFTRSSFYDRINEDAPPFSLNRDESKAEWFGLETRLDARHGAHHVVLGMEYQNHFKLDQMNSDEEPAEIYVDESNRNFTGALYVEDEVQFSQSLLGNFGIRYDYYDNFGSSINPRAALIYNPRQTTAFKLLFGTAFRAPSDYELHAGVDRVGNPDLEPENITSFELVAEHYVSPNFRLIASGYQIKLAELIGLDDELGEDVLIYRNDLETTTRGVEWEGERVWERGPRLRASYGFQVVSGEDEEEVVVNSPRHVAKLQFSAPLRQKSWRAGLEFQYTSSQKAFLSDEGQPDGFEGVYDLDGYLVANLRLINTRLWRGMGLAAGVYDLFDQRLLDPPGEEHDFSAIPQDGRTFGLELQYRFGQSRD